MSNIKDGGFFISAVFFRFRYFIFALKWLMNCVFRAECDDIAKGFCPYNS